MTDADDKTIADAVGTDDSTGLLSGPTVLASRYELLGLLGSGGMGTVYRARDRELEEDVALKVLKKELARAPGMLERFRREVKLARKVTHVNVARMFDIGEHEGDRFLTMELVEGEPLSAILSRGRLPIDRSLAIAREVLSGLAASHDAGVLHGDLKPANVICARTGRVVITDFGIARALGADLTSEATGTDSVMGTPQYMAPEQVEASRDLDGRADLYALGTMLFRLITGEAPWSGDSYVTVAAARLLHDPPDPGERMPSLAPEICAFIRKCMARRRDDRYPDARAAGIALSRLLPGEKPARASTPEAKLETSSMAARPARTVAVLPLLNQGSSDDAYLAGGLTDDLIDILSAVDQVRVRPRGAVAAFAGPDRDAREAGRTLGVDAVVEGSLRRAGDILRVTLRLLTVADGFQLWAKRFDRPASDFFAMGDEAGAEVARVLASEKVSGTRESPTDVAALDLYLRGRFIYRRAYFDVAEAVALLRAAHDRAPNDGRIAGAYALALMRHHHLALLPREVPERARALASMVLARDPSVTEAWIALGLVQLAEADMRSCATSLVRALEIAPRDVDALSWIGNLLLECGRIDDALEVFSAALAEDPDLRIVHTAVARAHALRRDWRASDAALDRAARGPSDDLLHWVFRTRLSAWRADPEHAQRVREGVERTALPLVMKERLEAMLDLTRTGTMTTSAQKVIFAELGEVTIPRRQALNAQLRIELSLRAGLTEEALATYAALETEAFIDLAWLDACSLLEPLRKTPQHAALRRSTAEHAAKILAVFDGSRVIPRARQAA